jgi:hypothetical protein
LNGPSLDGGPLRFLKLPLFLALPTRCLRICPALPAVTARARQVPDLVSPGRAGSSTTCGTVGQKPGRGTTLGCAGRARTRARALVRGARCIHSVTGGALDVAGSARCGALRSHIATYPHGDGELRDMGCPGAMVRRGRPHVQLG